MNQPGQLPVYSTYGASEWRAGLTLTQPLPTNGRFGLTGTVRHRTNTVVSDLDAAEARSRTMINSYRLDFVQPLFVPNALSLSLERARLNFEDSSRRFTVAQLDIVYDVTAEFLRLPARRTTAGDRARGACAAGGGVPAGFAQVHGGPDSRSGGATDGGRPGAEPEQPPVGRGRARRRRGPVQAALWAAMDGDVDVTAEDTPRICEVDSSARSRARWPTGPRSATPSPTAGAPRSPFRDGCRSALTGELRAYYDLTGSRLERRLPRSRRPVDLSWDDLERRPGNRGVTFSLRVPLWDSGVNGAEVAAAKAMLSRSDLDGEEQQRRVVQEVNAALTALTESRGRLEALGRSVELAGKSIEISVQRFANGDITSQELALDRDRLTQARMAYLDAFIGYQLAGADLRRQTLYDFEAGRTMVDE
ncbi:MAG: TolC family protein [bacterium]|nr:TolC family protein [bacterium]